MFDNSTLRSKRCVVRVRVRRFIDSFLLNPLEPIFSLSSIVASSLQTVPSSREGPAARPDLGTVTFAQCKKCVPKFFARDWSIFGTIPPAHDVRIRRKKVDFKLTRVEVELTAQMSCIDVPERTSQRMSDRWRSIKLMRSGRRLRRIWFSAFREAELACDHRHGNSNQSCRPQQQSHYCRCLM